MKCYYHPDSDAVAQCKACYRGLCRNCIAEVGKSSSCRNRCEAEVAILDELVQRGRAAYKKTSATYFRAGFFMIGIGFLVLLVGFLSGFSRLRPDLMALTIGMGTLSAGWGVSHLVSAKRLKEK